MKAVLFYNYGTPEVLQVENISKPSPKENELLVRIYATAVNSGDVRLRKADPFAVRFMLGLTKPKVNILGGVFSGVVESVGKNVSKFKPGDEIFGSTNMKFGAYAEYKCFDENETIALKPSALKHEQAAVLPFGGTTALHFLNKASLQKGQKILIYGASGSVGTAAVQLAKYLGAEVTAVCSTSNIELVKSLGADHVFDYTQGDILDADVKFDVIYDTVNKLQVSKCYKKLAKKGKLILGAAGGKEMLAGSFLSLFNSKKSYFGITKQSSKEIALLANLFENGILKPVIDKTFSLDKISEAHRYAEKGHKKGNVAISIS